MKKLTFHVVKTKEKFLENYRLSDRAAKIGETLLQENGLQSVPFGEDRRGQKVWEAGEDKPDRKIMKDRRALALLDWKGKREDDWMINERAYNSYIKWGDKLGLPVYVAIWSFGSNTGKFIRLPARNVRRRKMWDKNEVVEFDAEEMRPWTQLCEEVNTL